MCWNRQLVLVIPSPSLKHDLDEEVLLRLPGLFIIALTPMDTPLFGPRPASLTVTYVFSVQFEIRSAQIVRWMKGNGPLALGIV